MSRKRQTNLIVALMIIWALAMAFFAAGMRASAKPKHGPEQGAYVAPQPSGEQEQVCFGNNAYEMRYNPAQSSSRSSALAPATAVPRELRKLWELGCGMR